MESSVLRLEGVGHDNSTREWYTSRQLRVAAIVYNKGTAVAAHHRARDRDNFHCASLLRDVSEVLSPIIYGHLIEETTTVTPVGGGGGGFIQSLTHAG